MKRRPDPDGSFATRNREVIGAENLSYGGSGGVSEGNSGAGFRPAFLDTHTGVVHLSRYADGRPAPFHLVEGLPPELILRRAADGRGGLSGNCISGFFFRGHFYTRDEAATWMKESGAVA
ncbi:MAG: hypothetical protein U9R74_02200 [Pseudomonadota bacterium]|nr:hypothetical protein [Pseudomonadota bacterium]